ncbi:ferredoxin [Prauserella oleivorans]
MKVRADENRCQGHGLCNMTAPDVFDLSDEDGHVVIRTPEVPPELHDDAVRGWSRARRSRSPSSTSDHPGGSRTTTTATPNGGLVAWATSRWRNGTARSGSG